MALDSVKRTSVSVGDDFATSKIGTKHHQMVTLADQIGAIQGISTNPLIANANEPDSNYSSSAAEKNATATGSKVYKAKALLDPAIGTAHYLFLYNAASATGTPVDRQLIPPAGFGEVSYPAGKSVSGNWFVGVSTTFAAYSEIGTNSVVFTVEYDS